MLHRDPGRQDRPDHLGDDPLVLGVIAVGLVAGDVVDVGHDRQIRVAAIGSGQAQIDTDAVPAQLGDPARERPQRVGDRVEVRGSPANSRVYKLTAASAGSLTVVPAVVTSESAGPTITVRRI